MKKRFFAGVLSALLVLSTTAFALPQDGDTAITGTSYDGSTDLSLTGFTVAKATADYSTSDTYYHFTGTASSALKEASTASTITLNDVCSKPKTQVHVMEFDFMLGNTSTKLAVRGRVWQNPTDETNTSYTGDKTPQTLFSSFGIGDTKGNVTIKQSQWYRLAVVFNMEANKTTTYEVYLNGAKVSDSTDTDGYGLRFGRISPVISSGAMLDLSVDNIRIYSTTGNYTAGTSASVTAKADSSVEVNETDKVITIPAGMAETELTAALVPSTGAELTVVEDIDNTIAVRSADGLYTYYTWEESASTDSSYINLDFEDDTDLEALTTNNRFQTFEAVADAERSGKVLQMSWKSTATGAAYFTVNNSKLVTGSYIVSYALKRTGNASDVTLRWGESGTKKNIINLIYDDVSKVYATEVNGGNRPGEWIQYATFVDTVNKTATLYINGVQVGNPVALDAETMRYQSENDTYNYFRFYLEKGNTDAVYLDDLKVYPADSAEGLADWNCSLSATAGSGIAVTPLPAAMGKIDGAVGKTVSTLTYAEGTTLQVLKDGAVVDNTTPIEDGMVLKATRKGTTSLYQFTSNAGDWASYTYTGGQLTLYADSFDNSVIIIGHYKEDANGNPVLVKATIQNQTAGYKYLTETLADDAVYMKVFLWDNISTMSGCAEVLDTRTLQ